MLVTDPKAAQLVCNMVLSNREVAVDTETTGLDWHQDDKVVGVSVYLPVHKEAYYLPFRHGEGENLDLRWLGELLIVLSDRVWVGHNIGFDLKMLSKEHRFSMPPKIVDTTIAAHLCNENEPALKLEALMERYLDPDAGKSEAALLELLRERFGGAKSKLKGSMWKLPATDVWEYACQDVISTWQLYQFYLPIMRQHGFV